MNAAAHLSSLQGIWKSVHTGVANTAANALDDLIHSIFGDPARIGYELIQNADDANTKSGLHIDLNFYLLDNYLIVSHNGAHFSAQNVEALCRYGAMAGKETGEKQHDLQKIGYKGIGFKSVFNVSNRVWVLSGDYIFRFDKSFWQGKPMPWQIVPIPATWADVPEDLSLMLDREQVNFILEYKNEVNVSGIKSKLKSLFESEYLLLFLRHIRQINLFTAQKNGSLSTFRTMRRTMQGQVYQLERLDNGILKEQTQWHVTSFDIPVAAAVRETLVHLDKRQCPEKLKQAEQVEICFAAKLREDETVIALDKPLIFSYLPTTKRYEFPFLVNSNFLMNEARTELLDERWNEFLFEQIGYYQFMWFSQMAADKRFRHEFAGLLVKYADDTRDRRHQSLNTGVRRAQQEIAFVPVLKSSRLQKAPETIVDQTGFGEKLGEYQMVKDSFTEAAYEIADPLIKKINKLLLVGAAHFDHQTLKTALVKTKKYRSVEENGRLIHFFFQKIQSVDDYTDWTAWMQMLQETPFILNASGALCTPSELYFTAEMPDLPFKVQFESMHPTLFRNHIQPHPELSEWLQNIGVAPLKPLDIIRRSIFALLEQQQIHHQTALPVARFIFEHRESLTAKDYESLRQLPVLTGNHQLIPAHSAYLSDVYQPKLPLETWLQEDIFVSPVYLGENPDDFTVLHWNTFFSKLGARQEMALLLEDRYINQHELRHEWSAYFQYLQPYLPPYNKNNSYSILTILRPSYLDYATKNHAFAKAYWQILMKEKWSQLTEHAARARFVQNNRKFPVPSYFHFLVHTYTCFPADDGRQYPAPEVYSSALSEWTSGYFPVSAIALTRTQEQFLGIRMELTAADLLHLLQKIAELPDLLDKRRLSRLYQYLLSRRFQPEDFEKIPFFNRHFTLLAQDNTFQPLHHLVYFTLPRFAEKSDNSFLLFMDFAESEAAQFCKLFGIRQIKLEDLEVNYIPATPQAVSELQDIWLEQLPLLATIAAHRSGQPYENALAALRNRSEETQFVTTETLDLVLEQEGLRYFQRAVPAWTSADTLYYLRDWRTPLNLFSLQEALARHFNLPGMEREIGLFLTIEEPEIAGWLREQGLSAPPVAKKPVRKKQKTAKQVIQARPGAAAGPVQLLGPVAPDYAPELGRWGEQYVREKALIEEYYRLQDLGNAVVSWSNEGGEQFRPYDFEATLPDGRRQYWEVKAAPVAQKASIWLTGAEFQFALQKGDDFFLVVVLSAGKAKVSCKILRHPAQLIADKQVQVSGVQLEIN